jgi:hypothetical protein
MFLLFVHGSVLPGLRCITIAMFDGIMIDILELLLHIPLIPDRMLIETLLPYRFESPMISAGRLIEMAIVYRITMLGKMPFNGSYDIRILSGSAWCYNHMDMVRQHYDRIDTIVKYTHAMSKRGPKKIDILYENRVACMCNDGDIVAVTIQKYSSIICHVQQ